MIVGDFNIHIDDRNSPLTKTVLQLLDEYGMTQHINTPTHKNGHIFDLFITKHHADISPEINVIDPQISDHSSVVATVYVGQPPRKTRVRVSSRDIKDIPTVQFTSDVASDLAQLAQIIDGDEVNRNVKQYFEVCCKALDKYAPIITKCPGTECKVDDRGNKDYCADPMKPDGDGLISKYIVRFSGNIVTTVTGSLVWQRRRTVNNGHHVVVVGKHSLYLQT